MESSEAAAVIAAARKRARALVAGDRETLTALHHPALRWTTHAGVVLDRARYIDGNTSGDPLWIDQTLDDVDIQVADDRLATLTAVVTDVVRRDGPPETFRMRLTQTWIRTDSGWQCLAGHAGPRC